MTTSLLTEIQKNERLMEKYTQRVQNYPTGKNNYNDT